MSDGRTIWYAEDADWLTWERVTLLGLEFGPAAVSVLCALKCTAKRQGKTWTAKTGFTVLARQAFTTPDEARAIVERAGSIGLLDDLVVEDEFTFRCRVSGMAAGEQKARAAARQAAHRDRVTDRDEPSPTVTGRDKPSPTGQDRTGEDNNSPDGELSVDPPDDAVRLAGMLSRSIRERTGTPPGSGKHQATRKWAVAIDRMHRLDGRSWEQIENAIAWLHSGKGSASFWQANVLSADTLRAKFDQMALQARRDEPPGREGVSDIDAWLRERAA